MKIELRALVLIGSVALVLGLFHRHRRGQPKPDLTSQILTVRQTVLVTPTPGVESYRVRFLRIKASPGQTILSETWSPRIAGQESETEESGEDMAGEWIGWKITKPTQIREFFLETRVEVQNAGLTAPPREPTTTDNLSLFLQSDSLHDLTDPHLRELADSLPHGDTLVVLRGIWNLVTSRLRYGGYDPATRGASVAAVAWSGDCSEFTDLFVALCRLRQIPARSLRGWTPGTGPTRKHAWPEVWIGGRGWTAFEPTWAHNGASRFEWVPTPRVSLGWKAPGPQMEYNGYACWRWWGQPAIFASRDSIWATPTKP